MAEEEDDWELLAPFLALRPVHPQARRLRAHAAARRDKAHVPRRAGALSRDQIVRAAIAVADAEGAEAVSMRRIARELNAGTMSLYWHVGSKEELLDLMIDEVQAETQMPAPSGDWRAGLRELAFNSRTALHRHRWMMDFMGGRPPMGPKSLQNLERALAALDGLGLGTAEAITIVMTVATYALGAVLREVQEINGEAYQNMELAGLSDAERVAVVREFADRVRATGRYPHLVTMMDSGVDPDSPQTRQARFEFGVDCLLEGIAARLG
jgi:AcrR family transcriptional regulator